MSAACTVSVHYDVRISKTDLPKDVYERYVRISYQGGVTLDVFDLIEVERPVKSVMSS